MDQIGGVSYNQAINTFDYVKMKEDKQQINYYNYYLNKNNPTKVEKDQITKV